MSRSPGPVPYRPRTTAPRRSHGPSRCPKCARYLTRKLRLAKRCTCGATISGLFEVRP